MAAVKQTVNKIQICEPPNKFSYTDLNREFINKNVNCMNIMIQFCLMTLLIVSLSVTKKLCPFPYLLLRISQIVMFGGIVGVGPVGGGEGGGNHILGGPSKTVPCAHMICRLFH